MRIDIVCVSACNCSPLGSNSVQCDQTTGQCPCGPLFTGRDCSFCIEGYGNVTAGCRECDCDVGAIDGFCDSISGVCRCAPGVVGFRCDRCDVDHYDLSADGCKGKCHHWYVHAFFKFCYRALILAAIQGKPAISCYVILLQNGHWLLLYLYLSSLYFFLSHAGDLEIRD